MPRFQPRIRKQKARQRAEVASLKAQNGDSNQVELLPQEQKAARARHAALKAELQAGQPKFSRKKQKRLDKYIDNKLKKEQSLELLKKLAANQVDTSVLRSSRSLGIGDGTKRDAIEQRLKERRAGLPSDDDESTGDQAEFPSAGSEESEWSGLSANDEEQVPVRPESDSRPVSSLLVGSGLKRPLEVDADGNPVIKKRQRLDMEHAMAEMNTKMQLIDQLLSDSESDDEDSAGETSSQPTPAGNGEVAQFADDDSSTGMISDTSSESDDGDIDGDAALQSALFSLPRMKSDEQAAERSKAAMAAMEEWHNEARGAFPEPSNIEALKGLPANSQAPPPRPMEEDPLPQALQISNPMSKRKAYYVPIERTLEIQDARLKLSVVAEEQRIMEAIHNHRVVVVCGATGSGKTTQVPQFLYEAGYGSPNSPTPGLIGVTQPRRVAAVAMARRVGEELGLSSAKVSYQIRFDSTVDENTAIKFMTDGILIREIAEDFALCKYSAIVIDEAHERSVNTDILIGMVSRIVDLRSDMSSKDAKVKPLKLIIMSATLMRDAFIQNDNLFRRGLPPLVEAEGRQYEVVEHFARRTQRDYLEQAYQKITRGHRKLPPGTMLVFLTGQGEIATLSKRLKRAFGVTPSKEDGPKVRISGKDIPVEEEDLELGEDRVEDYGLGDDEEMGENEDEGFDLDDDEPSSSHALVQPLYSQLPTREQLKVFEPPPDNTRLIILATNVAETSITIPGIRYVFDCGRAKQKKYDKRTGVQSFEIDWISKASAKQRLGRAGRTGPGHCYRFYSSAVYEAQFPEHSDPEILSTPMESVVLQLKSMDLQHVANFPFPTPPARDDILQAEKLLGYLGALDLQHKITPVGRALSVYPISPRFSKMLAIGHQHDCIYLTTALVAALATPELFISETQLDLHEEVVAEGEIYDQSARLADDARAARRRAYNAVHAQFALLDPASDALKHLSAFCAYLWTQRPNSEQTAEEFCTKNFLRAKGLAEAAQLYRQLLAIIAIHHPGSCDPKRGVPLQPPTAKQATALKQFVAAGFIDQVAIRGDLAPVPPPTPTRSRRAIDVPYLTLFPSHAETRRNSGAEAAVDTAVYIHSSSVLARRHAAELPPFVVYARLQRSGARSIAADGTAVAGRTRIVPLVPATGATVRDLARGTPLLDLGKPVGKIEQLPPSAARRERRAVWVVPNLVGGEGQGTAKRRWPLPAVKMVQERRRGGEWREEKKGEAK